MAKGGVKSMKSQYSKVQRSKEEMRYGNRFVSSKKDEPYIICGGCSYTDHYFQSDYGDASGWAKWPEVLASQLGYNKFYNCGTSGGGNPRIWNIILETIYGEKRKPDAIFVCWSGWDRFDIWNQNVVTLSEVQNRMIAETTKDPEFMARRSRQYKNAVIGESTFDHMLYLAHMSHTAFRTFYFIQRYCQDNGIKFICSHAIAPVSEIILEKLLAHYNYENYMEVEAISRDIWASVYINRTRSALKRKYKTRDDYVKACENAPKLLKQFYIDCFSGFPTRSFDSEWAFEIETEHHVGWPYWQHLGGMSYDVKFHNLSLDRDAYIIRRGTKEKNYRDADFHPNEKGHEVMAQDMFDTYQDVYGLAEK